MSLFEWCKLAYEDYHIPFSLNHNFPNWISTVNQKAVDSKFLVEIGRSIRNQLPVYESTIGDKNSTDLLDLSIADALASGIDVRLSGPEVSDFGGDEIFANITLERYPIPYRSDDESPTLPTSLKPLRRTKGGRRPGGAKGGTRIVWLTPAEHLLRRLEAEPTSKRVSTAARLLGLDRAGQKCRLDFYRIGSAGTLRRPNIFSDVDPIRWACVRNNRYFGFGSTLDAATGLASLPEAIAKDIDLEGVAPDTLEGWHSESWFSSLRSEGFCGEVEVGDCPDLSSESDRARTFRRNADSEIRKDKPQAADCIIDCKDGNCEVPIGA